MARPPHPTDSGRPVSVTDPTLAIRTVGDAFAAAAAAMRHTAAVCPEVVLRDPNGFWRAYTEIPLAALLYAASPAGCGGGIRWAAQAVDNADPEGFAEPGWVQVLSWCRDHVALAVIVDRAITANADDRHTDSILLLLHDVIDCLTGARVATAAPRDGVTGVASPPLASPPPTAHQSVLKGQRT